MLRNLFHDASRKNMILVSGYVSPEPGRCVQCGICTYNCPIGIDVRLHAMRGEPVRDSRCLTCGECVTLCPRGVLSFEKASPASLKQGTGR